MSKSRPPPSQSNSMPARPQNDDMPEVAEFPPGVSHWTAPQSLQDPHAQQRGKQLPDADTVAKYLRRTTRPDLPDGPVPARWQRGAHLLAGISSVAVGIFMVFYMDFGPQEHCFSPLRRWAGTETANVSVFPKTADDSWIKKTGFTREELVEMVGEEELNKAQPEPFKRRRITAENLHAHQNQSEYQSSSLTEGTQGSNTAQQPSISDQVKGTIWNRERL
ncbi:unnamed protein product [Sympodiomycopsis kandeliae]